jgi:hypothetical protein
MVAVASSNGRVTLLRLGRDVVPHYDDAAGWKLGQVCQWNVHGSG